MRLVYVVGEPGAGKSTLCGVLRNWWMAVPIDRPIKHCLVLDADRPLYAELGWPADVFSGTDTLHMSVQPTAITWLTQHPYPLVLGEGDRLANPGFFTALRDSGAQVRLVWLDTDPDVAAERREARAEAVGRAQNAAWVRGRCTKVARLVESAPAVDRIDGALSLPEQADRLATLLGVPVPAERG